MIQHNPASAWRIFKCRELEITEQMKRMDFFVRQGADPQPYGVYGKGMQRGMAK